VIAVAIVVVFNNFIAILSTLLIQGVWPLLEIPGWSIKALIYASDIALGAIFANGVLYIWGLTKGMLHVKVFIGLLLFTSPVILFADGFKMYLWLELLYVASSSSAVGVALYLTERRVRG